MWGLEAHACSLHVFVMLHVSGAVDICLQSMYLCIL